MSNDLCALRLLMSQWPNSMGAHRIREATQSSISPAPASTSEANKKGEGTSRRLAQFGQSQVEAWFFPTAPPHDRNEEKDLDSQHVLEEQDKEENNSE